MSIEQNVFIGIGSNLDDPSYQVNNAIELMDHHHAIELIAVSSIYQSAPLGGMAQPDYCNAVARIATELSPWSLLRVLQQLENENGRQRGQHWGSRTLDLDILLFGDLYHQDPKLEIPHPGVYMRSFVLMPLAELEPGFIFPDGSEIAERVARCPATPINAVNE